jgi:uncharacterized phiE125 gp8 family phage protein
MASLTRAAYSGSPDPGYPVSLAEVKAGLRIDGDDDDTVLALLIAAATDDAQNRMRRAILPQDWILTLDGSFPAVIDLPWPIARTVTVEYQATEGIWTEFVTADSPPVDRFTLMSGPPSRLIPAYGEVWPTPIDHVDVIRVTFAAWSWPDAAAVPAGVKQWIIARVGELFEQRELSGPVQLYAHPFLNGLLAPHALPDYRYRNS